MIAKGRSRNRCPNKPTTTGREAGDKKKTLQTKTFQG